MDRTKSHSPFAHIADAELRAKLEKVHSEHEAQAAKADDVKGPIRFVFSRSTPVRAVGSMIRVRCALDENPRGGTIIEKVGKAYRVDVEGQLLTVFEPDEAWE